MESFVQTHKIPIEDPLEAYGQAELYTDRIDHGLTDSLARFEAKSHIRLV